jgi:hypothetical protein
MSAPYTIASTVPKMICRGSNVKSSIVRSRGGHSSAPFHVHCPPDRSGCSRNQTTISAGATSGSSRRGDRSVVGHTKPMKTIAAAAGSGCASATSSSQTAVFQPWPLRYDMIACSDSTTPSE